MSGHSSNPAEPAPVSATLWLPTARFGELLTGLADAGYALQAPVDTGPEIRFMPIKPDWSPVGMGRVRQADQGLKPWLFAPSEPLWKTVRQADGRLDFAPVTPAPAPLAVLGARSCDLAALRMHDAHFAEDPWYRERRKSLFIVAFDCHEPAAHCFCTATGDSPVCDQYFDLALAELDDGFVARVGSARGGEILDPLGLASARPEQRRAAERKSARACEVMEGQPDLSDVHEPLLANLNAPHWREIGRRCLGCGNCTAVCPSCFCSSEHESGDQHVRQWASCFEPEHSYMAGFHLRPDRAGRYRQWLTHKFATWHEQFGRSGCVGCGRCITACPVGIDPREEVQALCRS